MMDGHDSRDSREYGLIGGASDDTPGSDGILYSQSSFSTFYQRPAVDYRAALEPLLETLRAYDKARIQLEEKGGSVVILKDIVQILGRPMTMKSRFREHAVRLLDQNSVFECLEEIGNYRLHLDIRLTSHNMPVYYLCRVHQDYWAEHSLIVEDLYMSPGYSLTDERFARLMCDGHEEYFLRLSHFRPGVGELLSRNRPAASYEVDDFIHEIGRHVFQAAWHDDQRPGILTARYLGMPRFHQAIELLYLCLSGDLSELRWSVFEPVIDFFRTVYPQPAIHAFLKMIRNLDGDELNELPKKALNLFIQLSRAFSQFLQTDVEWGSRSIRTPLFKIIFGNFYRLDGIAAALIRDQGLVRASQKLDKTAESIIEHIVEEISHGG
ncbi:hypothetical protein JW906_07665 [bacterium]|nr:hypothetical protein [bacterium]